MTANIAGLAVVAAPSDSIDSVLRAMANRSRHVRHAGLALVLDGDGRLLGMLTDGDIRRTYARDIDFSNPVSQAMMSDPITLPADTPRDQIIPEVYRMVRRSGRHASDWIRHVPLIDGNGRLVDVLDFLDLLRTQGTGFQTVAVFGMGYVGLTLAVSLASRGHQVIGLDVKSELIAQLSQGRPHVHEPGLKDMLKVNLGRGKLTFDTTLGGHRQNVYIIAVGTPLDATHQPDQRAIGAVVETIGGLLKRGDQVMLRSTVPMGTTRGVVIPRLESLSGLRAGEDFHVSFAPERTIEGKAMQELRTLPQVIGGLTPRCAERASAFWTTLTQSVIQVDSLEASELVKLANNTFRDLSFAFANELALLADEYNVNAFDLIRAANEGYPRNSIPLPSPGVGGYCLTKDPILLGWGPHGPRATATLGRAGRAVNEKAALYPVAILERFAHRVGQSLDSLSVLIVGAAFKGEPETTDLRGSVALDLAQALRGRIRRLCVWDAVASAAELDALGFETVNDLETGVGQADAVLILNNHRSNAQLEAYLAPARAKLIFDGWHQLDPDEIEKVPGFVYATMGYMTSEKRAKTAD